MAGQLTIGTIDTGVASTPPVFNANGVQIGTLCRAWVNFNAAGTIRASFNVGSVTRNGTGDYTINFTNALPDANYAVQTTGSKSATTTGSSIILNIAENNVPTASALRLYSNPTNSGASVQEGTFATVAVFR